MRKFILFFVFVSIQGLALTQIPPGYYDPTYGLNGLGLKITLHNIIKNHNSISYSSLYSVLKYTDNKGNDIVWDIYSDNPFGNPPYTYSFNNTSDQCGQYNEEGDCYNKEHSWPQSWLNSSSPAYSDLFHIYPTDGYVNSKRGNLPYGEVNSPTWTSDNGSKIGLCVYPGYSSTVFEPIDEYKGDIARSYFYLTVRYYGEDNGWDGSFATEGADMKPWTFNLMYDWHIADPVSQKETDRNDAIYALQHNRNPFIDHPEWIDSIYLPVGIEQRVFTQEDVRVYPNPAEDFIKINCPETISEVSLFDICGRVVFVWNGIKDTHVRFALPVLGKGLYALEVKTTKNNKVMKKLTVL